MDMMSVSNGEMGPARRQPSLRALGAGVREFCLKVQRPESYSEPNTSHSHSLLQPHDAQTNWSGPSCLRLGWELQQSSRCNFGEFNNSKVWSEFQKESLVKPDWLVHQGSRHVRDEVFFVCVCWKMINVRSTLRARKPPKVTAYYITC